MEDPSDRVLSPELEPTGFTRNRNAADRHALETNWYLDSGYKASEISFRRNGNVHITRWRSDGSVLMQVIGVE